MDTIDSYLDELTRRLKLTPTATRRLLAETEEHLRDALDEAVAAGATPAEAEARALARFGTPREVARAANGGPLDLVGAGLVAVAQMVAAGCSVVLAGTLLAELLARITSTSWVFGPVSGFAPSRSQVSHWLQVQPTAHDWRHAAAMENAADSLVLRGGAALLGLVLAVAVLVVCVRRFGRLGGGVVPAVGLTAFGSAALVLAAAGVTGSFLIGELGRGQALCDAAVASAAALVYLRSCVRNVFVST